MKKCKHKWVSTLNKNNKFSKVECINCGCKVNHKEPDKNLFDRHYMGYFVGEDHEK